MTLKHTLFALFLLSAGPAAIAQQAPTDPYAEIKSLYRAELVALSNKDVDALFAHDQPRTSYVDENGQARTREQMSSGLKQAFSGPIRNASGEVNILLFVPMDGGQQATATVRSTVKVDVVPPDPDRKRLLGRTGYVTEPMVIDSAVFDTWQRTPDGWRRSRSQILDVNRFTDPAFAKELAEKKAKYGLNEIGKTQGEMDAQTWRVQKILEASRCNMARMGANTAARNGFLAVMPAC